MSIKEIKDITKLQKRLKSALDELKYIKKCCENAGEELAKHSFYYDHKEKNLVIQALELNEKYERREQECNNLRAKLNDIEKENEVLKTLVQLLSENGLFSQRYFKKENEKLKEKLKLAKNTLQYYAESSIPSQLYTTQQTKGAVYTLGWAECGPFKEVKYQIYYDCESAFKTIEELDKD